LNSKLEDAKLAKKRIYYYSSTKADKRANAVFLMSAWSMLYTQRTAEEAWEPFNGTLYPPLPPWHDATPTVCTYNLTVLDTLRGVAAAGRVGAFKLDAFPIEEYEWWEQPSNGDLSWIWHGKILAFAGPHNTRSSHDGYFTLTPEDYIPAFKKWGVKLVIRLNKPYYDETRFTDAGIEHLDVYYLDGSNPPEHLLQRVLQAMEDCDGAVAIHCKAGLGRTGTCIACYMMKHHGWSASEATGWLRVARPGSVIGPQQHFLEDMQPRMAAEGDTWRRRRAAVAAAAAKELRVATGGSAAGSSCGSGRSPLASAGATAMGSGGGYSTAPSPVIPGGGYSTAPAPASPGAFGGASAAGERVPGEGYHAASSPGGVSVASDASQGDHLRASRVVRGSPGASRLSAAAAARSSGSSSTTPGKSGLVRALNEGGGR
jgi:cell division cycle 14